MESLTGKTSEEVEIPKLAENGRNWKIYCAKIIEAAATDITDPLGVLAGWQPDDGSYDWECLDAILKWTFYTSVPISILCPIQKLDTMHKIFNYLAKRFFEQAGAAAEDISADSEKQKKSPTSADTATERHASAERNNEDLTTTKALTRGTEDVDNRNVGRQDPCTKAEASGTSAKCTETTPVVLKSALPHETQTKLQNSLPLTPRPPIEGEPSGCKQEAVESVVTAGRANGTVETAKPTEIADVNRTALLGRGLVERASGVNEGDRTECEPQSRLQQMQLYCKESRQRNEIANENIPSTYGLLLEGEWTVFASGEARDPKGDANALDTATEHAYHPSELRMTEDANGVESEGCREGASKSASVDVAAAECCQQLVGTADSDPSQGVEPAEMSNVSKTLVTVSVELEDLCSSGILHVCLGNRADGLRDHVDVLSGQTDAPSVETDADRPANKPENVNEPDGRGNLADTSSMYTDMHSIGNGTETPENETVNIRKCQIGQKTRNSPNATEIAMPEPASRWRRVGVGDVKLERAGEAIAPSVEGETACDDDGDGDRDGDGDGDGMTSGSSIDSMRVKAATHPASKPSVWTRYASMATRKDQDRIWKRQPNAKSRNDLPRMRQCSAATWKRFETFLWGP
ncbi:hypothetical protein SCLCIDRAFT_24644 [Scleroderma citrinum Foug A]|uniref:Uncharacterized protein n=1 Tax=Scleroderma citrinum Foug A TaxID=1036808 RepID=A0A0C3E449_9AGAM|nr:hypothetical protein SCLCIDRAFT_24644 [Scleroderma citrinum Foug A]